MSSRRQIALSLALTMLLASGLATAATRTVPSAAYPTIQSAIDAANDYDTVNVLAGVYYESLFIPDGLDGLRINGSCSNSSSVVIDGTFDGVDHLILDIDADDAYILCLTLRHGSTGIDADGDGLRVYRVHFVTYGDGQTDGLNLVGDRFQILNNVFKGHDNNSLEVVGRDGLIQYNSAELSDGTCFDLTIDNTQVRSNTIRHCDDGDGIYVEGHGNKIWLNTLSTVDREGIQANGSSNIISYNTMSNVGSDGIRISGDDNLIENNELVAIETTSGAINVDGDHNIVKRNTVQDSTADACYDIDGDSAFVEYNTATNCEGGFEVRGQNPIVLNNTATNTGNGEGFDIDCVDNNEGAFVCHDSSGLEFDFATCAGPADDAACQGILSDAGATCVANRDECSASSCCSTGRIEYNTARHTAGDNENFDITAASGLTGLSIQRNTGEYSSGNCLLLRADGATIKNNNARYCGAEGEAGIQITGDDNTIGFNLSRDNGGDGVALASGSRNDFSYTQAMYNIGDGIHICTSGGTCNDNIVHRSITRYNLGEGIENDGAGTALTSNFSNLNRTDCAEGGSNTTTSGTTCSDGSNFAADGTVD